MNKINGNVAENSDSKSLTKIKFNRYTNKSMSAGDMFQVKKNRIRAVSSSINTKEKALKNFDIKLSNTKINSGSAKYKLLSSSAIKIAKYKTRKLHKIGRNKSVNDLSAIKKRMTGRGSITTSDTTNLPKLSGNKFFVNKKNINKSKTCNKLLFSKGNQDYNNFYNVFNEDKNFFLGVEFQKKMKKELKIKNPLKKTNLTFE